MRFETVVALSFGALLVVGCGGGGARSPDGGGSGGAGTGGSSTGGAGTGGAGTAGAGTGGSNTGGAGTGGVNTGGRGGTGTGGAGSGGSTGGGGGGGAGGGGRGGGTAGSGGRGGGAGAAGAGGEAGVSYTGCSFVGGIDRVTVLKHDAIRDLCVLLVFAGGGTNTSQITLPANWRVEYAAAVSPAGTCSSRTPPLNAVQSTGQTGTASWTTAVPSWPYGVATLDVTLVFPAGAAPIMTSERMQAAAVNVRTPCQ